MESNATNYNFHVMLLVVNAMFLANLASNLVNLTRKLNGY